MNNRRLGTTLLLVVGVVGVGGTMRGAGQYREMRYVDASATPGEKHIYSIITVNGVGLRSEPSKQAP